MPVTEAISSASISREMLPRDDRRKRRSGAALASAEADLSISERPAARVLVRDAITLSGEQTAGGVALIDGDVCIRAAEPADTDNGAYVVREGDWERVSTLYDGQVWTVREGDYAKTVWLVDAADPIEYGTTMIGWVQQLSNVEITSSDETVLIQRNNSNPAIPQFDLSVNPAAGVIASDLSLIVQEVYGELFDIIENSSQYMREGSRISVMVDVTFLFPAGDLLGSIIGLPYARTGPEFAATGIVVTPYEHAPGHFTTHHVVVRPDPEDEAAIRVYWPTGYFYHPEGEGMVEGNYRLIVEFFYLTDGSEIGVVYVQDFEEVDIYIADTDSTDIYQVSL